MRKSYPVLDDFFDYDWKNVAPQHAYWAYALSLYANLPDVIEVASEALTEGTDDKDVDLCLLDPEAGEAYIGQCYVGDDWGKDGAPANKADDLLTGLSGLLNRATKDIPEILRKKAIELQEGLQNGDISAIHLLFIHNCKESAAVKSSLNTVASSAKTLIQNDAVSVTTIEIGLPRLQHLYDSLTKQIAVEDAIEFEVEGTLEESGEGWNALQTTIPGVALHDLWQKYKDDLFSANIRGFLDMLGRKTSINRGILNTVSLSPTRFWAFNNGVTILTKKITNNKPNRVQALGVSIINGAQTSGVLGKAPREQAAKIRVPCRFIQSSDPKLVEQIVLYNNTQNAIKAFDFRSNDPVQQGLKLGFHKFEIEYVHRRQGASRLPPGSIQAETIAPYLAAFHGEFQVAIRQRRTIFEEQSTYSTVFPKQITAEHVYLVQSLADAVNALKMQLTEKVNGGTANEPEQQVHSLLSYSTSKLFVVAIVGRLASLILDRPVPDPFAWKVRASYLKPDRNSVVSRWKVAVDSLLPLVVAHAGDKDKMYQTVRSSTDFHELARKLALQVQSLRRQYDSVMASIKEISELT